MRSIKYPPARKQYMIQSLVAVLVIAVVLIVDLVTKAAVAGSMDRGDSLTVIDGFFNITYVQNTGAAWSMGSGCEGFMNVVIVLTFVIVAAVLFVLAYPDSRKNMLLVVSLAMVSSGAVGNLVDRLMLGYVRDFFDFDIFGYDFPVFNVADISLVVGVLLLIVCICLYFFTPRPVTEELEKSDGEDDPE